MSTDGAARYAKYKRLLFERPHPHVLRIAITKKSPERPPFAVLHHELVEIWSDVAADPDINAVIVTGEGDTFCEGGDRASIDAIVNDFDVRARHWKEARDLVYNIINCEKPIVSAMRGLAQGAGLACGLLADVSIATKNAQLIERHVNMGVVPGDHAMIVWPLLCGLAKTKYYLLSGEPVTGEEAERIGLVALAVDDDQLEATSLEVATRLAEGAQNAIRWTKYALNNVLRSAGPTFDTSLTLEFLGFSSPHFNIKPR
jgi:enoyl-CoA hydratase